jgi:hypothetical protein
VLALKRKVFSFSILLLALAGLVFTIVHSSPQASDINARVHTVNVIVNGAVIYTNKQPKPTERVYIYETLSGNRRRLIGQSLPLNLIPNGGVSQQTNRIYSLFFAGQTGATYTAVVIPGNCAVTFTIPASYKKSLITFADSRLLGSREGKVLDRIAIPCRQGPSPTPSVAPSATPTRTPSPTPSVTARPTPTPSVRPTPTPSVTPTVTPTPTPSPTPTPTTRPFSLLIVADEDSRDTAQDLKNYIRSIKPFSQVGNQLAIEVYRSTNSELDCHNVSIHGETYPSCSNRAIGKIAVLKHAHVTAVMSSHVDRGYASGHIAVVSNDSDSVRALFLHELGHAIANFGDEYSFDSADERKWFCQEGAPDSQLHLPNITSFDPHSSYDSDSQAKTIHRSMIPWINAILPDTPITHNVGERKLGTAPDAVASSKVALYRGGGCNRWIPTWRGHREETIMGIDSTTIPPLHRRLFVEAMGQLRGAPMVLR